MRVSMLCWVLLALVGGGAPLRAQGAGGVRVVVNAANPATSVSRQLAEQLFLKQRTRWSDNTVVVVLDQVPGSTARRAFSKDVLRREVSAVKSYWQQMAYSGRGAAPQELAGDAQVLAAVRSNAAAVGYIAADTPLGEGVKELPISGL